MSPDTLLRVISKLVAVPPAVLSQSVCISGACQLDDGVLPLHTITHADTQAPVLATYKQQQQQGIGVRSLDHRCCQFWTPRLHAMTSAKQATSFQCNSSVVKRNDSLCSL